MRDFKLKTPDQEFFNDSNMSFPAVLVRALFALMILFGGIWYAYFINILVNG